MAHAEYMRKWSKTAYGRAYKCWGHILERIENRDGHHPTYAHVKLLMTRQEFMAWAVPKYKEWMEKHPGERPSIHRLQDSGHYEISNLTIISYEQNTRLQARYRNVNAPPGMAWCGPCKAYKPTSEFNRNAQGSNGLHWLCRYHEHLKANNRRAANIEFHRKRDREKMQRLRKKWKAEGN